MAESPSPKTRKWADIVAMLAAVVSLGNAAWGPLIFTSVASDPTRGDRGIGYNWLAFVLGGLVAVLGLFLAQRWSRPGRILVALGGLMLVLVPFAWERFEALPIVSSVVLGLAMLIAAPFVGPMPAPWEERAGASSGP
jgi:peptidoglycan/LPS O-acetylase OafA/YrhL